MSLEGKTYKLGDVADVSWGDTNTTKSAYVSDGYPAYSASGHDGFLPYADFEKTGVVVSAIGANCGKTWLAKGKWSCIKNTIRMWSKSSLLDTEYLYWLSTRNNFFPIRGSAQPFISQGDARAVSINLPAISDQKAIAHILGTLDDKIELNQKMNETLEDIAKAIFKSWFVDFDPVRAKAESRPTGLPAEISDLFPDAMEESEIGEIPAGWALQPLYDLGTFINGAAYKAFEPNNRRAGLPIIKIAELKSGITEQTGFSNVEMDEKYLVRERDILFSWSGNPDTSIDTFVWQRDPAWLNQHIFKVVPRIAEFRPFLMQILRHKKPTFSEIARNKQTTGLGHVTVKDLKEMKIAVPPEQLVTASGAVLSALQERIFLAMKENILLADLRDTLLPKLISGELRVPDAEKFLAEAGI